MHRRDDHDPAALDALAHRLDLAFETIDASTVAGRRAERAVREAAALLHRLADDVRLVNRFLREASLLAPAPGELDDDDDDDPPRPDDSPARAHGTPPA